MNDNCKTHDYIAQHFCPCFSLYVVFMTSALDLLVHDLHFKAKEICIHEEHCCRNCIHCEKCCRKLLSINTIKPLQLVDEPVDESDQET